MKEYRVDCIYKGVFNQKQTFKARSPKEAAEKVVGRKVKRVTHGGNIVVFGECEGRYVNYCKSYVYEVDE